MALPSQTLAAIQSAGAAIYAADTALKEAVQSYAEQVKLAMLENPFDMSNDGLFEDWKTVARLSRTVGQVEAEFQKIYRVASDLSTGSALPIFAMPSLTATQTRTTGDITLVQEVDATDAVIKSSSNRPRLKANAKPEQMQPLNGNSAKVLAKLLDLLNPDAFVRINRSAVATEIGIPKGSIGATITRLIDSGHLMEDAAGQYKLGSGTAR